MTTHAVRRGLHGGAAVALGQLCKIAIQLIGMVALSRILSPADFGLIAMVTVFLAFGELLRDFGMPTAALQARTLSQQQASNVFWINVALGAAAALALVVATPALVVFYSEPRVAQIAPIMAVTLLLNGIQAQLQVQLARGSKFIALASTDVVAQTAALVVAIAAAASGLGYWALVLQVLTAALTLLAGRMIVARWWPSRPRRNGGETGVLVRAGGQFGLAQLLTFGANNVDSLAIGAYWGPTQLGLYNRAFQIFVLPRSALLDPMTQVVVPTANSAREAGATHEVLLLRLQFGLSALVGYVYMLGAAVASWAIPFALGPQWVDAVPIFMILAAGGTFAALGSVNFWAFVLAGQSKQLLVLHLVTKPLAIALVLLALPFGVTAIAVGYVLAVALSWPINLIWLSRTTGQHSWAFFRDGGRVLLAVAVGLAAAAGLSGVVGTPDSWQTALLCGLASTLAFLLALAAIPGGWERIRASLAVATSLLRRAGAE
ncbi:lipopolysaccharide biosynthesis protein [Microbacterium sp. NPDC056569]|uniref:lipopolysaccharide biosynthesis protein n=1 Tax=Microbacterium sp. NPDC056569 TaxID=3345867 RepID=UPI00366C6970